MLRTSAILVVALLLIGPVQAGDGPLGLGLFRKRSKPSEPAARAKQLITTLQNDTDEKKRRQAAEELRGIDPRSHAEVVPTLIGSLQHDPSPAVRAEAAESIGHLKPVYQPAGIAMETALASDPDPKVREAVKSALWNYHLNGYQTPPSGNPLETPTRTAEPPLAARAKAPSSEPPRKIPFVTRPADATGFRPITNSVGKGVFYQSTPEPPLARPLLNTARSATEAKVPSPTILPPPLPAKSIPDPAAKSSPTGPSTISPPPPLPTAAPATGSSESTGVPSVSVPTIPPPSKPNG